MNEEIVRKCDKNIPNSLKAEKRWCLYKLTKRKEKVIKIPITIHGDFAKVNDISTFSTYDDSKRALLNGVGLGLGFLLGGGYVGIDIDRVDNEISEYLCDEDAKNMTADFLSNIDTYAELSPSKKGIHLIGKGKINGSRRRYKNLEIYENDRFFTVTGDILTDKDRSKVNDITNDLSSLYKKYMPKEKQTKEVKSKFRKYKPITFAENNTPLDMLFKYGYFNYSGDDLRSIYNGNFENYFDSQSEADFFMLRRLLYYTGGDVGTAIFYMESSGLVRNKWYRSYTGTDYIHYIAYRALNTMNKFYNWDRYKNEENDKKGREETMRRYETSDLKNLLSLAREEIKEDTKEYINFLKTMGNNYKYPYAHQLSIYTVKPDSTACAEYDYWKKIGRTVKSGEKGIPLLDFISGKVKYIFDVKQTTTLKYEITKLTIFEYNSKNHIKVLDTLNDDFRESSGHSLRTEKEKINVLSKLYVKKHFDYLIDNLSDVSLKSASKVEILKFLSLSLTISVSERLGIKSDINTDELSLLSKITESKDIDTLLSHISKTNKNILLDIGKEIQNINSKEKIKEIFKKEQTRDNDERYNDAENVSEGIGGLKNGRNSNGSREKISERYEDIHPSSKRKPIREKGRDIQNENDGRWQSGFSDEYQDATDDRRNEPNEDTKSKAEVLKREQGNRVSDDGNGKDIDEASGDDTKTSRGLYGDRRTKDDEVLGIDERLEENGLYEIRRFKEKHGYGADEHSNERDSLSVENNIAANNKKEVEKSTSFFYSKEKPNVLMTDEMLGRVPKLYKTEKIELADREVHAAYFIPFSSNWTWYLCEYDKKTGNAFGLVLGSEVEWGYFNVSELKDLKAQRLILEDFPKTFRELKNTELKKQLTESELRKAFNGKLSFEEEAKENDTILEKDLDKKSLDDVDGIINTDNSRNLILKYKDNLIGLEIDYNGKRHVIESFHDEKIVLNEILTDETMNPVFGAGYHKDIFISDVKERLVKEIYTLDLIEKSVLKEHDKVNEKVAVKVGYYYALIDKEKLKDINLSKTDTKVYPKVDNLKGAIYPLYAGETFEDSNKIDKLFNELANELKNGDTNNLNDYFDMNKQGLFEILDDKVTSYKEGYDFEVSSFSKQFPNYHNDIYIANQNLKINGVKQNIAYIGKDNKIKFNVELPEDEKAKILEIRDKKEVISVLIDKDIKEKAEYYFDNGREIYTLLTKNIEGERFQKPISRDLKDEPNNTYSAELVLDFKSKQLRQHLKYGEKLVKSNNAISYKNQNEIFRNLPYLLEDSHKFVMLEGFIHEQIERDKEKLSHQNSTYDVGTKVRYNNLEYEISRIDDKSTPKEIELEDNAGFMNGFITGSETILFNDYNELDLEIIEDDKTLNRHVENSSQLSLGNIFETYNQVENKEKAKDEIQSDEISSNKPKEDTSLTNFKITKEHENLKPSERLNNNIEAIKVLIKLRNENIDATDDEKEILSKYVGWGGLADTFNEKKGGQWYDARQFLKDNLSQSEYEAARESTLTAFFTPKIVIDSIYKAISNMGFVSGNILEPALGTGRFIGALPDEMATSKFYGSEIDKISAEIAKALYPKSRINIEGFEKTKFSNNLFDLAVGNVPFGDFKLADREYDKNNFLIHDYFFAKTLDKVRSGGLVAFITSSGTMDKQSDDIRRYISERAEFLGAIRLPNNVFKGEAGTEVTSDIIFLKKRDRLLKIDEDWQELKINEDGLFYNKYFVDSPDMVLGKMGAISSAYGTKLACLDDGLNLKEKLDKAIKNISGVYENVQLNEELKNETLPADIDTANYSFALQNGSIYFREDSIMQKVNLKDTDIERVKSYIELEKALREVIRKQKDDLSDKEVSSSQNILSNLYDTFNKKYGRLNSRTNKRLLRDDASFSLVSALENLDEDGKFKNKADIFTERTIRKAEPVKSVETSFDALILSINTKGGIDIDYMKSLVNKSDIEMINELKGEIFLDLDSFEPTNTLPFNEAISSSDFSRRFVTKDEYLSGNIRDKIEVIDLYIKNVKNELSDGFFDYNEKEKFNIELDNLNFHKDRLLELMPKELQANEISVRLGTTWIPTSDYKDFIIELLKVKGSIKMEISVDYSNLTGEYRVNGKNLDYSNDLANLTYGTSRKNAYKLIEDALNLRDTKVFDYYTDEDGKRKAELNKKETMLARSKEEIIKNEFKKWIYDDVNRRDRLVKFYNENFNSLRLREYDGLNLSFEEMNKDIELRPHQKDAVYRGMFGGNTLLAHCVGAGKTFVMIAIAMESKRLGLCNKSMFVVPNHITEQFGREFNELYPLANILVATEKDFTPARRKRFCSKIATGNYDAIIIGHTQFEMIPISKERQSYELNQQINEIMDYIAMYKNEKDQNFTVKQMMKTQKSLEARLARLNDDFKKDDVVTFEELGIDKVFVDEVHKFKNLYLYSKMNNVAGISSTASQRASDMFMKCQYLNEITNNKGTVFATGTPVSNSMAELFTMQRYMQYDELKKINHHHFDAWAASFGETVTAVELSPDGNGYRSKTRFAQFYNLPELMTMVKQFMDIKTADMLSLPVPTAHYEVIKTMPTEEQKEILKSFGDRADKIRNREVDSSVDNMLLITNDGKKMALDQRLINPLLPDDENSKVNIAVKNIFSIWEKYKEERLAQLVFCDMSTPGKDFNIYDDIKEKLIKIGVPENEIEFVHSANNNKQKDKLFEKVRKGEVRVLIGSTAKMGEGTNAQNKLIAIHDLDVPWRPSDLEQRGGRGIRQGNENKDVYIFRYITENTFDGYLWQMIERKQKFISQIMTSKTPVRTMEEIDEATLNYAELKALSTGNPFIREKMDLDLEVSRLKMLESNFKSNIYKLEDKVYKIYPGDIKNLENKIKGLRDDIKNLEPYNTGESKFTAFILDGKRYTDKKLAGEFLLNKIKNARISENKDTKLGEYRNFEIFTRYNTFSNKYDFTLKGSTTHYGEFGTDATGNITRLDNVLDKMPERLENTISKLENTKNMLENAKIEIKKEFPEKDLLNEKLLRLAEINNLIELGEDNEFKQSDPLLDEVKKEIIEFLNTEYEEAIDIKDFDEKYPDLTDVGIAFTTTPDELHTISASFDLVNFKFNQYVDDTLINSYQYTYDKNDASDVKELIKIKDEISLSTFNDFIDINEEELFNTLSLAISDDGDFYDPLSKDLDNDGIIDRYDNDFRDSDYLESNFDVDGLKKDEKPSVIAKLERYKTLSENDNKNIDVQEYNSDLQYAKVR